MGQFDSLTTITTVNITPAYCDYIAHTIQRDLKFQDSRDRELLSSVGVVNYDLDKNGVFLSTKKTIRVEDIYGKVYQITVEEVIDGM
jgi:hypothetical protein